MAELLSFSLDSLIISLDVEQASIWGEGIKRSGTSPILRDRASIVRGIWVDRKKEELSRVSQSSGWPLIGV